MKIREYRDKTNKTQAKCATELGITAVYFSDLERGVYEPSRKLAAKIIKWSKGKITLSDLWGPH